MSCSSQVLAKQLVRTRQQQTKMYQARDSASPPVMSDWCGWQTNAQINGMAMQADSMKNTLAMTNVYSHLHDLRAVESSTLTLTLGLLSTSSSLPPAPSSSPSPSSSTPYSHAHAHLHPHHHHRLTLTLIASWLSARITCTLNHVLPAGSEIRSRRDADCQLHYGSCSGPALSLSC